MTAANNQSHQGKPKLIKTRNVFMIVLIVVSISLVLGIVIANFGRTYRNARNDVIELSKNSSARNAESIEMFFTRHEDLLLATAEVLEFAVIESDADDLEIRALLKNMSDEYNENIYKKFANKDFTGIYASVNGKMINAYREDYELPPGYDPTTRPWYIEGIKGGGSVVFGNPYYDIYDPEVKLMSATKLLSDSETVIGMDITLEDMQHIGGNIDVSVTLNGKKHSYGYGLVLTGNGVVVAHNDKDEQGKNYGDRNNPMYGTFVKIGKCADRGSDYFETDINGENFGVFPRRLSNGWYVVTFTDLEDVRTTISDFAKSSYAGMIFIILLGTLYCFFILRAYTKTLKLSDTLRIALNMARTDALTEFGNRAAYDIRVMELKEKVKSGDCPLAFIMMDLNDLKYINDYYGHEAGDLYIKNCCKLMNSLFSCDIYRIGGDEFALFLTGKDYENYESLFDSLRKAVSEANISLTPSVDKPSLAVGMALHTVGCDDIDGMLRKADAEMYTNKVAIKQARLEHTEKGYTEDLKHKVLDKQMLASEMRKALYEEQFEVWFQPQVNHYNNGALIGAEALVRWRHPTRGMIPPGEFIPMFEYNGLIYELDKYVWKHTCSCIRKWIDDGLPLLPVSVNVSRLDIIQKDFVDVIISYIREYDIPYYLIHLEITESAFSDNTGNVVEVVKGLISRGFSISIDDFGSGYSSLSLLRNVPAHMIKLDMRFFGDGENQARNECIIESIIKMAKMLGMAVLAEGVEQKEQADLLLMLGCAYIQGYLYSKPLSYDEYVEYMKATANEAVDKTNGDIGDKYEDDTMQSQKLFHNIISGTNDVIIVVDNKTHRLLYANPAAEAHYGKRFDPLKPITCMQYCEKGEQCKNCPAKDMRPGERREVVISEYGSHIKSLYTQMDWNGHDAIVIYQTDISDEFREIEYANSVLNCLGVGIVVFHGNTPNELVPVFCNKEYLELSGLSEDDYKSMLSKDSLYGVHPDDIADARRRFAESFKEGHPMQSYIRVQKVGRGYEWVSLYAKINHLEAGDFEVYMMFSDAEEEMRRRLIDAERYKTYISASKGFTDNDLTVVHFNLTKNTSHCLYRVISVHNVPDFSHGLDEFISVGSMNVSDDAIREEFKRMFSTENLIRRYEHGVFTHKIKMPLILTDNRIIWCYQSVNVSKNPNTGDIEAIMILTEADKTIRFEEYNRLIVKKDYDLVASVNVKTGYITIISEREEYDLPHIENGVTCYKDILTDRISSLVSGEYVDKCLEELSLDAIIKYLDEIDTSYHRSYPAKESVVGKNSFIWWRFGYVDEQKTEILFSRRIQTEHNN